MFPKEFGAKAGVTFDNKYQIQLKKKLFAAQKSRSSHRRCSVKKACKCKHRCSPVNVAKFLRTPILKNICEWLHLKIGTSAANLPKGDIS